jgi:hypothetical protein
MSDAGDLFHAVKLLLLDRSLEAYDSVTYKERKESGLVDLRNGSSDRRHPSTSTNSRDGNLRSIRV